jgi:hypothetical protein
MRKLILTMTLGLFLMSKALAAHCPAASDFIQTPGILWGGSLSLNVTAAEDWYIEDVRSINASFAYFPNDATLLVRIGAESGDVSCLYLLPDNSRIAAYAHYKKINKDKINLTIFIPEHLDNGLHLQDGRRWQDDPSITSLACNTTAYNSQTCYWVWA